MKTKSKIHMYDDNVGVAPRVGGMTKSGKADMINAAISRSEVALKYKCAARLQDGTIFYTMLKGRHEVCVRLFDILFTLKIEDVRAIKAIA